MARRHIKNGLSYSDVLDYQQERSLSGRGAGARTAPIHIYLTLAAGYRSQATDPLYTAHSTYRIGMEPADCKRIARDSLNKARAWRMEIGLGA